MRAQAGAEIDLRIEIGHRHAVLGRGRMQQGGGRLDVRPLAHQIRRHHHRQTPRQREIGQGETRDVGRARRPGRQHGQQMVGLLQLVAQGRQAGAGLFHLGLQGQHIRPGGRAQFEALAGDVELVLLGLQDGFGGRDLLAHLGLSEGRGHDVARQGQARACQLVGLVIGLRSQRFERTAVAAEQVEVVVNGNPGVVQVVERLLVSALAAAGRVGLVTAGAEPGVDGRIQGGAGLRRMELLGLAQRGLGSGQGEAVMQRLLHQIVESGRAEGRPPLGRHGLAHHDALRRRLSRVAGDHRGIRRPEIGAHRSTARQHRGSGQPPDVALRQQVERRHRSYPVYWLVQPGPRLPLIPR